MGGFAKKVSAVVEEVRQAFMSTEPGANEIIAVLRDDEVGRDDVADLVAAYLKDKKDFDVHFDSDEWDDFTDALRRAVPKYL